MSQMRSVRLEDAIVEAMQKLTDRDGISDSEQLRRGVLLYLKKKQITVKGGKKGTK
jgi:hypothetical protein